MDKYEKIRVVGKGAFGTVYLCRQLSNQKLAIIKQIPVDQMTRDERQMAVNEAKVLSMLDHPNIIQYYDNFLEDKTLSIVMEYAEGGTLFEYLQHRGNALLEEGEVLRLFCQLLLSLQHVHAKQILHRDLKTQNILLNKRRDVVKIGDFGISKILSSKSKAFTVVGTPCYISPELCEGKPYNQKSDIWAVGCVLYELLTLKRAFEADNLPALVMKIMRGSIAPISDRYSDDLKRLLLQMLHLDPDKRPTINQVIAEQTILNTLANVYMEMGRVKCPLILPKRVGVTTSNTKGSSKPQHNKQGLTRKSSKLVLDSGNSSLPKLQPLSTVYTWGHGVSAPVTLPHPHSDILVVQVSTGRTQKVAVTQTGRLMIWESSMSCSSVMLPGAVQPLDTSSMLAGGLGPVFIPRYLEGQSAVIIKHVSCGDMYTACLTDRGILMTYGSGAHGCLGHGDHQDISQAKIVEDLLGYEVVMVSCGASHVMAVTNDSDVFSWGRGDNGRLGVDTQDLICSPQAVLLPVDCRITDVQCGLDCSMILTEQNQVLACGCNRFNKLGLDSIDANHKTSSKLDEVHLLTPQATAPLPELCISSIAVGTAHTAVVSDGRVFSWGKSSRGRLGRRTENSDVPQRVDLNQDEPFTITSICCNHGNTLLSTRPYENAANSS